MSTRMMDLRRRYGAWAVVTGASSGIGKSFAELLSRAHVNTVCVSNEEPELRSVCAALASEYGTESIPCPVDLAREDFMERVADSVGSREIGMLICCASFGFVGPFETGDLTRYTDLVHVSVFSYFRLAWEYYPKMLARNAGAIILTSSVNAVSPLGFSAVYTACKAFELYLGGALRWESRNTGLDIMVLLPGPTKTGFQAKAGTRVAPWAAEPEKVVERALECLGRKWILITGWRNRLFQVVLGLLPLKERILLGSRLYAGVLLKDRRSAAGGGLPRN